MRAVIVLALVGLGCDSGFVPPRGDAGELVDAGVSPEPDAQWVIDDAGQVVIVDAGVVVDAMPAIDAGPQSCDPVSPQAPRFSELRACPPAIHCFPDSSPLRLSECKHMTGARTQGASCVLHSDCAAGYHCPSQVCLRWCDIGGPASQCPGPPCIGQFPGRPQYAGTREIGHCPP